MAISFSCECGKRLQARDEHAGKTVRCPECGKTAKVPQAAEERTAIMDEPARDRPERDREPPSPRRDRYEDDYRRPPEPQGSSGKAVFALVLGIASFCGTILFGIPAILFAIWGLADIKRSQGRLGGKGMAIAAIILACVGSLGSAVVAGGLFWSIQKVRGAANEAKSKSNLRQIGIAFNNCDAQSMRMPTGAIYSADGKPLLSWRVALLPYLETEDFGLYSQFRIDEPWDSPNNIKLLARMPRVYALPGSSDEKTTDQTYYRIFHMTGPPGASVGERPVFARNEFFSLAQIERGTSNTILVVEAAESVPWTKPDELPFPVTGDIEKLLRGGPKGYCNMLAADGHVFTYVKGQGKDAILRAAITRDSTTYMNLPY